MSIPEQTFFNHYILFPNDAPTKGLTEKYRRNSLLLGICTLGVIHFTCVIVYVFKKLMGRGSHPVSEQLKPTADKATLVSTPQFSDSKKTEVASTTSVNSDNRPYSKGSLYIDTFDTSIIGRNQFMQKTYHHKITLLNGEDWQKNPGDFLVSCQIGHLSNPINGLPENIVLPGCLFYTTDKGFEFKKKGETISFLFDGNRIDLIAEDLIISEQDGIKTGIFFDTSLKRVYDKCYYEQQGRDQNPVPVEQLFTLDNVEYFKPPHASYIQSSHYELIQPILEQLKKISTQAVISSLNLGLNPRIANTHTFIEKEQITITAEMPSIDLKDVKVHSLSDGSLLLYAPKLNVPQTGTSYIKLFNSKLYPILNDIDQSNYSLNYERGILTITFKIKKSEETT